MRVVINILRRAHTAWWQFWHMYVGVKYRITILLHRYPALLRRISKKYGDSKLRVLFLVGNSAKWKMQTLFDYMRQSGKYHPFIALTIQDQETSYSREEKIEHLKKLRRYFEVRNMEVVDAIAGEDSHPVSLSEFTPDIVFYQMPWYIDESQSPFVVSKYALTCYVPYFVQNYGNLTMDCCEPFHRYLWRHFTLNNYWSKAFMDAQDSTTGRAGAVEGTGHPMLDTFERMDSVGDGSVIYAPHWSCGVGERYSTFHKNWRRMFQFARDHSDVKWIFKPHPSLKKVVIDNHIMSPREVEEYYNAWEALGETCYDGDYLRLFARSSAIITDCGSFLVEYACTGKPIIHLVSDEMLFKPHPVAQMLFDTYYSVHNWEEFCRTFDDVVVRCNDYKREIRQKTVSDMNLIGENAAQNIVECLDRNFKYEAE